MLYSPNSIDIAVRRKLHIKISFFNQKFEMLSNLNNLMIIKIYGIILLKGLL